MKLILILDNVGASDIKRKSDLNIFCRHVKIRMVAHLGGFNDIASGREIQLARTEGIMPRGFELHHIIPLCCSNTKIALDNMLIMDSTSHKFLHRYIYDVALSGCVIGEQRTVIIPDFNLKKVAMYNLLDTRFIDRIKGKERE